MTTVSTICAYAMRAACGAYVLSPGEHDGRAPDGLTVSRVWVQLSACGTFTYVCAFAYGTLSTEEARGAFARRLEGTGATNVVVDVCIRRPDVEAEAAALVRSMLLAVEGNA